ncbi:MAG: hypothetical protein IPK78_18100 [Rhodospirillales bacterium]|nr:hypothetical protein [Rhodospirillales bacterium]
MATAAKSSFGTFLKLGDGASSETFTTITEVKDIKGPALKLSIEEVTSHSSTAGWIEKIGTLLEGGTVTFEMNWIPGHATQSYSAGLLKDMVNRTLRNFQLVVPAASTLTWTIAAYVAEFQPDLKVKGAQVVSVTLELSGQPTLA